MTADIAVSLAGTLAKGGEAVKAGPVGLVVILLLCVASYFLFRSMSKHLRGVRENFPADAAAPGARGGSVVDAAPADPGTGAGAHTSGTDITRADTVPRSPTADSDT